jgi:hypothetical protein
MSADWPILLAAVVIGAAVFWTFWSANTGRKMSRWYRRKLRRVVFLLLLVIGASVMLLR